jgi:excisionase family DNA binding protein
VLLSRESSRSIDRQARCGAASQFEDLVVERDLMAFSCRRNHRHIDRMSGLANEDPAAPQQLLAGLLCPGEVACMLGVSRSWLYDAAKDGRVPSIRLGGQDGPVRFVERDLAEWVERARAGWLPGDSTADTLRRAAA